MERGAASSADRPATVETGRTILGTGPGAGDWMLRTARAERERRFVEWCFAASLNGTTSRPVTTESETPRPSSRETATPPRWVSDAERTVGAKPSV